MEYITFCTLFFILGLVDDLKINIRPKFRLLIMIFFLLNLVIFNDFYIEKTGLEFLNEFLEIDDIKPVIIFEWIHIKNSNFIKLYKKLEEKNYKLLRIEKDLICFKKNLDVKFSININ